MSSYYVPHGLSHHLHNFMFLTHRQDLSLFHWEMYSFSRRAGTRAGKACWSWSWYKHWVSPSRLSILILMDLLLQTIYNAPKIRNHSKQGKKVTYFILRVLVLKELRRFTCFMKIKSLEGRTFKAINLSLDWGIIQRFIDSQSLLSPCGAGEVSNIFISVLSPVRV